MSIKWFEKGAHRAGQAEKGPELRLTSSYIMLNRSALENIEGDHIRIGVFENKVYVTSGTNEDGFKLGKGRSSRKVQLPTLVQAMQDDGAQKGVYKGEWKEADKVWEFSWEGPITPRGRHNETKAEAAKEEEKPSEPTKASRRKTKKESAEKAVAQSA